MYFEKLPKAWQDAINAEIKNAGGDERPDVAPAYREYEARYRDEFNTDREPDERDREEIGLSYFDFQAGWDAHAQRVGTSIVKQ